MDHKTKLLNKWERLLIDSGLSMWRGYDTNKVVYGGYTLFEDEIQRQNFNYTPEGQKVDGRKFSRLGAKLSEESKKKMSEAHKGHKHSLETRQKMSAAAKEYRKTHTRTNDVCGCLDKPHRCKGYCEACYQRKRRKERDTKK
jgi:NUMOD3 motif